MENAPVGVTGRAKAKNAQAGSSGNAHVNAIINADTVNRAKTPFPGRSNTRVRSESSECSDYDSNQTDHHSDVLLLNPDTDYEHVDPSENTGKGSQLDEELEILLGEDPCKDLSIGADLNAQLAIRWNGILRKGLTKDERVAIKAKFPFPGNCSLKAPPLNPELGKAVTLYVKERDEALSRMHNNVAVAASAFGSIISELLINDQTLDRKKLISSLSDATRFLLGTMYSFSSYRRKNIVQNIGLVDAIDLLQQSPIYPMLFGEDLIEKLKAARAVNKITEGLHPTQKSKPRNISGSNNYNVQSAMSSKNSSRPLSYRNRSSHNLKNSGQAKKEGETYRRGDYSRRRPYRR